KYPDYKIQLFVQRLKFVGHFIETAVKLSILGYYKPSPAQAKMLTGALDQLSLLVEALRKEGLIQNPQKAPTQQLYLDLIGDASHAVYAMELAAGDRGIRY
ncbi:MAG: hypothetical protein VX278_21820, partial [Myxococcota bacterium]|nr:hypothetical protein [Myxococcota bacterium]